jgi:hypothetical protein
LVARGGYTLKQVSEMEPEEILYIHYHQDLMDQNRFKSLFKAMGVLWNKSDLDAVKDKNAEEIDSDEIFIPLSMVINPKVLDLVKSNRKAKDSPKLLGDGSAIPVELGEVRSMSDLPKEEFYRMIGQQMPSKLPVSTKKELEKKWIKDQK